MKYNEIQRAIRLIRKTGDRIILFDSENKQNGYVLLSLEEYERLMVDRNDVRDLTEDELLDKINRDIAIWKSEQEANVSQAEPGFGSRLSNRGQVAKVSQNNQSDNQSRSSRYSAGLKPLPEDQKSVKERKIEQVEERDKQKWQIPPERKQAAEEIIEEDRQYLEYIPF